MTPVSDTPSRPARAGRARWSLLAGAAAAVLVVDQLTKVWAVEALSGRSIDLVGSLRLRLVRNFDSAFSLVEGRGALLPLLAIVIMAYLTYSGRYATTVASALSVGLVLGGAVGNLVDRAVRTGDGFLGGGVVDFVDLQWWPIFNVADMAISVGAVLLFLTQLRADDVPADQPGDDHSGERPAA